MNQVRTDTILGEKADREMALRDTACYTLFITPSGRHADHAELSESGSSSSGPSTNPGNGSEEKKGQLRYVRVKESREGEVYSSVIYGTSPFGPSPCLTPLLDRTRNGKGGWEVLERRFDVS